MRNRCTHYIAIGIAIAVAIVRVGSIISNTADAVSTIVPTLTALLGV
jgi:hypothetical protein